MKDILISFLGDEYKEYIEYKGFFKKLNENLDVILYLCNNLSNDRIKNYIINSIENGDYYDNYDDLGEGISVIDENDIFEKITKGDEYNKMLDYAHKNLENIYKMYSEFAEEYMNIIKYNNEKYDLDKQKLYISDKFENIVSKLETLKIVKSKDDIKFNIILIDKESFIDYKAFKRLFKNLHIQEKSNIGNDKILLEFKEKLTKIYNLIFIDLIAKFKEYNLDVEQLITETKELVKLLKN
jgi:hypothetical protein